MTSQPDINPPIVNFELVVIVENLSVTPRDNDLEVSAQFIVNGFGKTAFKNIYIPVNPKDSPETLLEKILDNMKEHLAASLVTTCRANLVESVFHAFNAEKSAARENILKMYKDDFNERNAMLKSSKAVTLEQIISEGIDAWIKLEKKLGKTIESPKKAQLTNEWGIDEQLLTYYIGRFPTMLLEDALENAPNRQIAIGRYGASYNPKPSYKTFLNILRFYKEQKAKED